MEKLLSLNKFKSQIPNIGWRDVSTNNKKLNKISRFYFVHNYYCVLKMQKIVYL